MIKIRAATADDTEQLEELFLITRQHDFKWHSPEVFKKGDYQKSVEGEEVWVAESEGKIVGFVSIWVQSSFIHNLFIHPDWQSKGIGKQLMKKAEERVPSPIQLKVEIPNTKATLFYHNQGWETKSTHKDEPVPYHLLEYSSKK